MVAPSLEPKVVMVFDAVMVHIAPWVAKQPQTTNINKYLETYEA